MKKIWLFILFLCCALCSRGQIVNANGQTTMFASRPLGEYLNAVIWNEFQLTGTMPSDAVVQGIYPVVIANGVCDQAFHDGANGPATTFGGLGGHFAGNTGLFELPSLLQCSSGNINAEYYDASIGTNLSLIPAERIGIGLTQSLFIFGGMLDTLNATGVGVAVYYTSATPTTDSLMPPPFTVPAGQGLAWAVPSSLITTGALTNTGTAVGVPATSNNARKNVAGLINYPNGKGFNGLLRVTLPNGTIKNICSTPYQVVPKFTSSFKVVNGFVQFGNATLLSNDCLMPRLVYNVELDDSSNNLNALDNWYLPQNNDLFYGIGDLQAENFGGPITIAVPKGIISNPTQSQVITQPTGTSLNLVGTILINGVTFATAGGGVTYTGLVQTNPTASQIVTQPGGTFLNLIGDIRINGATFNTGVTSWNGRTGAIAPTTGDYTCSQVTGCGGNGNYQTFKNNGTALPQETVANFISPFLLTDSGGATNITFAPSGVTANTYTFPSSITVDSFGRVLGIVSGGTTLAQQDLIITTGLCSTANTSFARCTTGTHSWPNAYADTNYTITCTGFNPSAVTMTGLFVTNKTASGFQLILQNGTSNGANAATFSEVDCHASHL